MVKRGMPASSTPSDIAIDEDVVAVSGAYIPSSQARGSIFVQGNYWVARTCERNGVKFIVCDRTQYKLKQLLNDNFNMLDHIVTLRNAEVTRMLSAAATARQEDDDDDPARQKRESNNRI